MKPCNSSSASAFVPMKDITIHLHFYLRLCRISVTMKGFDIFTAGNLLIVDKKSTTNMEIERLSNNFSP